MAADSSSSDPEKGIVPASQQNPHHEHEHHRHPSSSSISASSIDSHHSHSHSHSQDEHDQDHITSDKTPIEAPVDVINDNASPSKEHGVSRTQSRASSRSRAVSIVPRSKRRGLFGRFAILPEIENPYDYKVSTKWGITGIISAATAAAPLGSSIFYPALPAITRQLDTTETVTNLSVAMYMLSMSIFPLWWSAFSEQYGRRTIYLISFSMFTVFAVLSAISTNIAMLIIFRILSGGASASVQAVGAGTISDIWEPRERGRAMSIFYLGPLLGPLFAPIIGGALAQGFGWRASMYFLAIYGLIVLIAIFFLLPETLVIKPQEPVAPLQRTTTRESIKIQSKKTAAAVKHYLFDPLRVLAFLRFPPVLITVVVAAIAFGALFVANISIQQRFSEPPYNFAELIVGLMYIPSGLGYFTAALVGGKWIDSIMAREARKANRYDADGKLIYLPEDRMRENMWLANTFYPLGLLLYGWTLQKGIFWFVPAIGAFIFGFASMLVFSVATTMLTEFVRKKSSAGVAVNNFVRNILSCIFTIVAAPWLNAWKPGWVFTFLCILCMLIGYSGIFILSKNAPRWRKQMDQALNEG